ncbi:hypothetical protein ACLMJK_003769 [Lecanora helva]
MELSSSALPLPRLTLLPPLLPPLLLPLAPDRVARLAVGVCALSAITPAALASLPPGVAGLPSVVAARSGATSGWPTPSRGNIRIGSFVLLRRGYPQWCP